MGTILGSPIFGNPHIGLSVGWFTGFLDLVGAGPNPKPWTLHELMYEGILGCLLLGMREFERKETFI